MTRTAISPRFAISTLENTTYLRRVTFDRAKAILSGTRFADLRHVAETGSTNADLADAARSGDGECALVADHQSAGRGRLDRRWDAPAGASLLLSVLVRPPFPAGGPHLLGTALGLAAVDALGTPGGARVGLKWPNDVVAVGTGADGGDRKLGGLLAEYVAGAEPAVVVGLGLNLHWPHGFPPDLAEVATSVDLLGGDVDRWDLVVDLLRRFEGVGDLAGSGAACDELVARYRERCVTVGRRVRVELPAGVLVGTAVDVDPSGALVVEDDQLVRRTVTAGDVVHLRPA